MNDILQETIFRITSKEDAKSINDISKNGIGKSLMAKVEEWAKSKNIKLIRLNSGGTRTLN